MPHRRIAAAFLALVLLVPVPAAALGIEKGVKAGLNLSNFHGQAADVQNTSTKAGLVVGAFVAFGFAPDLAIQVEGLYSMKGMKTTVQNVDTEGNVGGTHDSFVIVNYLEIPVLLRGTLLRTEVVQPMYYLGPTVGFSLGGEVRTDASGGQTQDLTQLKTVDLGFALGAGAGIQVGGRRILTEFRYTTGFADIYDVAGNLESINHLFSITAGLTF